VAPDKLAWIRIKKPLGKIKPNEMVLIDATYHGKNQIRINPPTRKLLKKILLIESTRCSHVKKNLKNFPGNFFQLL